MERERPAGVYSDSIAASCKQVSLQVTFFRWAFATVLDQPRME